MKWALPDTISRFNPKLVRLEASASFRSAASTGQFQSQTGSIRSRGPASVIWWARSRFNPKLVRLEGTPPRPKPETQLVSIPNWFD